MFTVYLGRVVKASTRRSVYTMELNAAPDGRFLIDADRGVWYSSTLYQLLQWQDERHQLHPRDLVLLDLFKLMFGVLIQYYI